MQAAHGKPFLTAQWRRLAMANYVLDPVVLAPHLPAGTEIDSWRGNTFVSLVGFLFLDTKVKGFPIPFHRNFEEVNLRFYVRRRTSDGWRRGVVFIKEIVPTESRIIYCQSRQREDCFQKAVIKRGLRRIRRSALRARSSSSQ